MDSNGTVVNAIVFERSVQMDETTTHITNIGEFQYVLIMVKI